MYGPIQYRLNQGTAKKWAVLLASSPWHFDCAQLSFLVEEETHGSPEGLLAIIAQPEPTLAWDGVSHLYDGEQFYLSENMKKRLKLRGTLPEFSSFSEALESVRDMAAHHGLDISH